MTSSVTNSQKISVMLDRSLKTTESHQKSQRVIKDLKWSFRITKFIKGHCNLLKGTKNQFRRLVDFTQIWCEKNMSRKKDTQIWLKLGKKNINITYA